LPHIAHLYEPRTAYQFEKDIDFFLKYYEPVDLDFLKNNCHLKKPDKNYFHLTFDDGLREVYDIIAPILLRKGVPATIFLNVDFVDNQALFFRYKASLILDFFNKKEVSKGEYLEIENIAPKGLLHINFLNKNKLDEIAQILNIDFDDFLKEKQPYLETNKIQSLASQGFTFGGHSLNHPLFSEIPLSEKVRQATESTIFAKRITAQKTGAFAFPFTDFGVENTFFNKIFREKNIDISFGTAGLKQQRYAQHWQRFPMEEGEGTAEELVKTEYLYYMVKRLFGKHF
jgi:peptidoglycan/xylan/chitin deacetylase (PgdA/CDA1 family)